VWTTLEDVGWWYREENSKESEARYLVIHPSVDIQASWSPANNEQDRELCYQSCETTILREIYFTIRFWNKLIWDWIRILKNFAYVLKAGDNRKFLNYLQEAFKSGNRVQGTYWLKNYITGRTEMRFLLLRNAKNGWMLKDWKEAFTRTHLPLLRTLSRPDLSECGINQGDYQRGRRFSASCNWLDIAIEIECCCYFVKEWNQKMFRIMLEEGRPFRWKKRLFDLTMVDKSLLTPIQG